MKDGHLCAGLIAILVGVLGIATPAALRLRAAPMFGLPAPTGGSAVGTSALTLSNGSGVQVWYPAPAGAPGRRAPYRLAPPATTLTDRWRSAIVGTNAALDVPVAAGKHPVLIYIPAWGGIRSDNTAQAENLASHGFIVVAMDDLYPREPMDFSSDRRYRRTLAWAARKCRLQAQAAQQVVESLGALSAGRGDTRFAGRFDLERVGMFGFSFGGAVAAEAATSDPRIRAVANLDGWIFSQAAEHGVSAPFLIFSTSTADPQAAAAADSQTRNVAQFDRQNLKQIVAGFRNHGGYLLTIGGTGHSNFTDAPFLPSVRHRDVGPIDKQRAASIIAVYLVQFFEHYLAGSEAPLLRAKAMIGPARALGATFDPVARLEIWTSAQVTSARPGAAVTPVRSKLANFKRTKPLTT